MSYTSNTRIGFIGIGLMGSSMVIRLLAAGFTVTIWNRDETKCDPLLQQGASKATNLEDLARTSDVIMLSLSNTTAVEDVVFKTAGFLTSCKPRTVLVDFSSISPTSTKEFARQARETSQIDWIDCPVSGGVSGARAGTLSAMAGGDSDTIDSLRSILSHLAQRVTRMGPVGCGQTTKVFNQMIVSTNILLLAEVFGLASKAGVNSSEIPAALKGGFADSLPLQITGQRMADLDFDEIEWHTKTLLKDLRLASEVGHQLHAKTPLTDLALRLMSQFSDGGHAESDPSSLVQEYLT